MERTISFGYWIRRRRKALDLTQEALARQAGYATATIKKIEADERRPSRQMAGRLASVLKIAAEDHETFLRMARAERCTDHLTIADSDPPPALSASAHHPHNLPAQLTSLIGREREMARVCGLLRRTNLRLVTLTGPGGVGKTRLALQIAAKQLDDFADGVYFVSLAPISDPNLVAVTIAQTLGLAATIALTQGQCESDNRSSLQRLKDYLRDKQPLLLLDNFEHVAEAAPLVGELLASSSGLKVLVTSRTTLRLSGEREVVVPPLSLPDHKQPADPDGLLQSEATRLFVERARARKTGFAVTSEHAPAIAEICRRLDGLPLAIELAAARIKLFSPQTLLARLSSPLKLLTCGARDLPARQQTLRATLDWSYNLLDEGEKRLFARMAVFVGGCTLEAIAAVCGDKKIEESPGLPVSLSSDDVLDTLSSLVDQSLVRQEIQADGEPRFGMPETIHEYALERLELSGEAEALRRQHAAYYLALAEAAEAQSRGPHVETWLARLEQEFDNVRAMIAWSQTIEDGAELALRLAPALRWFCHMRGYQNEGRSWLDAALDRSSAVVATVRAQALYSAGMMALGQADYPRGHALFEESLALFREVEDKVGIAQAIFGLGGVADARGDYGRARALFEESLALLRELGDKCGIAIILSNLAWIAHDQGDYGQVDTLNEESLALFRELGDKRGIAGWLTLVGLTALEQGDLMRGYAMHAESLVLFRELGHKPGIEAALNNLGGVAYHQGNYEHARALYEESLAQCREMGDKHGIPVSLKNLGLVALAQGDHLRAQAYFTESLAQFQEQGNKRRIAECLEGLAGVAAAQTKPEQAARLWGAAEALREAIGTPMWMIDRPAYDHRVAVASAACDVATFAAAWAEGRAWPLEQAIAYVL